MNEFKLHWSALLGRWAPSFFYSSLFLNLLHWDAFGWGFEVKECSLVTMDGTCNCCNSSNLSIGSPLQNYCPHFSYIFTPIIWVISAGQKHRFTYTAGKGLCRKPWHFSAPSLNWSSASSLVYFKVIFCALQSAAKLFLRTKILEQVLCKSFIENFTSLFYTISFFPFFVNNLIDLVLSMVCRAQQM